MQPGHPRRTGRLALTCSLTVLIAACTGSEGSDRPATAEELEWDGTITTEGSVTTVVNRGGSVWGGPAVLVEEASIGVLEGADEYMLGQVSGVAATDAHIYVIDRQVPAVRIYDLDGGYVGDLGARGEGPGEYTRPASIGVAPDGRILVRDEGTRRILVYSSAHEYLEAYRLEGGLSTGTPMTIASDGTPYTIVIVENLPDDPSRLWLLGMKAHGPQGPHGEPVTPPEYDFESGVIVARREGSTSMNNVPFYPTSTWVMRPDLSLVSGVSDRYRFEIRAPDGAITIVEKTWEPVPVDPDEADWSRRRATANMRQTDPEWVWNGPEVPPTKPAYSSFVPALSGETWVVRPGPGERLPDCREDPEESRDYWTYPCWRDRTTVDAFGADGRFLGEVVAPEGMGLSYPRPHIDGTTVIATVSDDFGTVFVKRYRLVRPRDS